MSHKVIVDTDSATELVHAMLLEDLEMVRSGGYDEDEGLEEALIKVLDLYTAGGFTGE